MSQDPSASKIQQYFCKDQWDPNLYDYYKYRCFNWYFRQDCVLTSQPQWQNHSSYIVPLLKQQHGCSYVLVLTFNRVIKLFDTNYSQEFNNNAHNNDGGLVKKSIIVTKVSCKLFYVIQAAKRFLIDIKEFGHTYIYPFTMLLLLSFTLFTPWVFLLSITLATFVCIIIIQIIM